MSDAGWRGAAGACAFGLVGAGAGYAIGKTKKQRAEHARTGGLAGVLVGALAIYLVASSPMTLGPGPVVGAPRF